ncbi:YaaR family protein [Clostridium sp. MSJ-4]|uniref:YaaR family protein n=1 Tax=Clostridium simiarum TaxID=2841506 RepID=A0ABS6EWD5_9CLOT|nr:MULTISPECIES: YaaR family protein [Clostridium]MBU5590526.1 YaaR family protein [Clostridium simiarum]
MEIGRISKSPSVTSDRKKVESRKDFSQSFSFARERRSEEELKKLLEDIKKKGNRLIITKCYGDVRAYKNLIKEYLEAVMGYMYKIKKDISFWQTQYFITVETIDKKLEELTELLLQEEKENLDIAATIDEIQGLVLDIYK